MFCRKGATSSTPSCHKTLSDKEVTGAGGELRPYEMGPLDDLGPHVPAEPGCGVGRWALAKPVLGGAGPLPDRFKVSDFRLCQDFIEDGRIRYEIHLCFQECVEFLLALPTRFGDDVGTGGIDAHQCEDG